MKRRSFALAVVVALVATARADWKDYRLDQRCNKLSDTLFRADPNDWTAARITEIETFCQHSLPGLLLLTQLHVFRGEYPEARRQLQLAERLPGAQTSGRYFFWRAYLLAQGGDHLRSLVEYRRAGSLGGVESWVIDYNTADVLMAAGRLEEALAAYRRAIKVRADRRGVMLGYAVALDRAGDVEGATRILAQTLRGDRRIERLWPKGLVLFPAEEEHVYRALILSHLGKAREATEALARFLELAPASPWAAHAAERLATFSLGVDRSR